MCAGICGPSDEKFRNGARYHRKMIKKIKQKKVPYKNLSGTVLRQHEADRVFVQMYKSRKTHEYVVTWRVGLSTGAATYGDKEDAIKEYLKHIPK